MKEPLVTVIIPTHNRERLITRAVESVLSQTYPGIEIIVVDDGSTDKTREALAPFFLHVTYLRLEQSLGAAAARNRGLAAAKGKFIAFLDSDDIWLPQKTWAQLSYLSSHPEVGAVHANAVQIDENEKVIGPMDDSTYVQSGDLFRTLLLWRSLIILSTLIVRRECLERVGGFDESLRTGEDWHLFVRLARGYRFGYLPESLVLKRTHAGSLTSMAYTSMDNSATFQSLGKVLELFPDIDRLTKRHAYTARYFHYGYTNFKRGDFRNSRGLFRKSLRHSPFYLRAWGFLALSCFPRFASWLFKRDSGEEV